MRSAMNIAAIITLGVAPAPAAEDTDCACHNRDGVKVPVGQTSCLTVGNRSFTARCAWSQNLLTWRKLHDGCLSSQTQAPPAHQG